MGILADADDDPVARWKEITDRLGREGIKPSASSNPKGAIIDGSPRVGVWLMPNNVCSGELENFVAQMIPAGDAVWPHAERYINKIPSADRKFSEGKILRAQIHAWLAARKEPRRMGLAVRTHDLAVDGALCHSFASWLKELFR